MGPSSSAICGCACAGVPACPLAGPQPPRRYAVGRPQEVRVPFGIGPLELIIVLVIVLIIFGPKRLPGLGRSLGSGMREFKDSVTGKTKDDDDDEPDKVEARALPSAEGSPSEPREENAVSDRGA